jgi:hypothetical protein
LRWSKENLVLVWREFTRCLFRHFNKYVRRFSLESMAYVLGRVDREVLEGFYREVMGRRGRGGGGGGAELGDVLPDEDYWWVYYAFRGGWVWQALGVYVWGVWQEGGEEGEEKGEEEGEDN